jgi:uncharacterized surface protein with fasciclin (FAS1) repeats
MRKVGFLVLLLTLLTALAVTAQEATVEPVAQPTAQMEISTEATAEVLADTGAHVRFAHFAPNAPAVQIMLNGAVDEALEALEYPSMSDWMTVEAGTLNLEIASTGAGETVSLLGPADLSVSAGTWQTIALVGTNPVNAVVVQEVYDEPLPGTGGLTFFNALEGSPAVDLHRNDVIFFAALDYPTAEGGTFFSTLMADSGTYDFRVTDNQDPSAQLAEAMGQELEENAYTFIALIGTLDDPQLFVDVTDRSEVAIELGLLPEPGTLIDALGADDNLTALESVFASSDMAEMMTADDAEYTIFAPANFALDDMLAAGVSSDQVSSLLMNHTVEGKLTSRDLLNGDPITTLAGTPLTVTVEGNNIYVNGVQVIAVNIPASNGVIHMLSGVLPSAAQ